MIKQPTKAWREDAIGRLRGFAPGGARSTEALGAAGTLLVVAATTGRVMARLSDPAPFSPREAVEMAGALRGLQAMAWAAGVEMLSGAGRASLDAAMKLIQPVADDLEHLFPDERPGVSA